MKEQTLTEINFALSEKKEKLMKQNIDIFVLNPEISKLILEIKELEDKKKELEEQN